MNERHPENPPSMWRSSSGLALLGFLAIAGFFLLTEHRAHVFGVVPYVLLALCPLLHLLGHGGHGSRSDGTQQGDDREH